MRKISKTSDIIDGVETIRVQANGIDFEVDTQGEGDKMIFVFMDGQSMALPGVFKCLILQI